MTAAAASALRLAVLISGRGSNMLAIARACARDPAAMQVATVISDQPEAAGIPAAREMGLDARVVAARDWRRTAGFDRAGFEGELQRHIDASGPHLVVLAGFMRILSPAFAGRYAGRLLNIHPSLLPRYPGLHTHARALAAGDAEHGASVHYVTAELDGGPVVLQGRVPVLPGDTVETLSARVHAVEHRIYPEVIRWVATGRLEWNDGRPKLDGEVLQAPRQWRQE